VAFDGYHQNLIPVMKNSVLKNQHRDNFRTELIQNKPGLFVNRTQLTAIKAPIGDSEGFYQIYLRILLNSIPSAAFGLFSIRGTSFGSS
jgi:hypothetical protein